MGTYETGRAEMRYDIVRALEERREIYTSTDDAYKVIDSLINLIEAME